MKRMLPIWIICLIASSSAMAQPERWQQKADYTMDVQMDVTTNRFTGKQRIDYWNNSPDTLNKIFYHLYWNAFQPNSMMDVRSREMGKQSFGGRMDWDGRVRDRINNLKENEIGYQSVSALKVDGRAQQLRMHESILEVVLDKPILPDSKVSIELEFEAQVPLQIRRSGRDNEQGIRYSMSQWFPKLCNYDYEGWHADPYVGREFYGNWGNFDVKITIDKSYVLGGTGYLQNANEIGYGYEDPGTKVPKNKGKTNTWHFVAPEVHDFMWAADPKYKVVRKEVPDGPTLYVLYKPSSRAVDAEWIYIADAVAIMFPFIEKNFGPYPYKQYSFIEGGDGGMEYAMSTLLKGPGLGTVIHELMHSWYQMVLASNELLYPWMDEGFTSYASSLVDSFFKSATQKTPESNPTGTGPRKTQAAALPLHHADAYRSYLMLAKSGVEEPMSTHADHYSSNFAYSIASYSKGEVFLSQLGYIIGSDLLSKTLLAFYDIWKFKHPNDKDFIRVAEKVSGLQLSWYRQYWVNTTKTIDYKIDALDEVNNETLVKLRRIGHMPMPIDLEITYKDGSKELHYIPLNMMYGEKPNEQAGITRITHSAWNWTHPTYEIKLTRKIADLKSIEIDPTKRLADIDPSNNFAGER